MHGRLCWPFATAGWSRTCRSIFGYLGLVSGPVDRRETTQALKTPATLAEPPHRAWKRIGLWGHYHGGNQGDECVVRALIQNIRRRCPDAEIIGFSLNPEDARHRHGIEAYPIRVSAERRASAGPETAVSEPGSPGGHLRAFVRRVRPLRTFALWVGRGLETILAVAREPAFLWRSYRRLKGTDLVIVAG